MDLDGPIAFAIVFGSLFATVPCWFSALAGARSVVRSQKSTIGEVVVGWLSGVTVFALLYLTIVNWIGDVGLLVCILVAAGLAFGVSRTIVVLRLRE